MSFTEKYSAVLNVVFYWVFNIGVDVIKIVLLYKIYSVLKDIKLKK